MARPADGSPDAQPNDGPDAASDTASAADPAATLVSPGLPCLTCRYDLGGLDAAGLCPECGRPIADSLLDRPLIGTRPADRARLVEGLKLASTGALWWVLGVAAAAIKLAIDAIAGDLGPDAAWSILIWLFALATGLTLGVGWLLLSLAERDRSGAVLPTRARAWRRLLRPLAIVSVVLAPAGAVLALAGRPERLPAGVFTLHDAIPAAMLGVLLLVWIAGHAAGLRLAAALCARTGDDALAASLRKAQWLPVQIIAGYGIALALLPVVMLASLILFFTPVLYFTTATLAVPLLLAFAALRAAVLLRRAARAVRAVA